MTAGTRANRRRATLLATSIALLIGGSSCATFRPEPVTPPPAASPAVVGARHELLVTATAYNSTQTQTDSDPFITAYGVKLRPGMQVIAVSRDLEERGLRAGSRVRIEGLPGEWEVADRMPADRRRAIDVYMGLDIAAAREFGRRELKLRW